MVTLCVLQRARRVEQLDVLSDVATSTRPFAACALVGGGSATLRRGRSARSSWMDRGKVGYSSDSYTYTLLPRRHGHVCRSMCVLFVVDYTVWLLSMQLLYLVEHRAMTVMTSLRNHCSGCPYISVCMIAPGQAITCSEEILGRIS